MDLGRGIGDEVLESGVGTGWMKDKTLGCACKKREGEGKKKIEDKRSNSRK